MKTRHAGWTLIELLVAFTLAVLVAGMSATVLSSLTTGVARSSVRAVYDQATQSVVDRIADELEAGMLPREGSALDNGGEGVRVMTGRDPNRTSLDGMEFSAWLPDPADPDRVMPFRLRYILDPEMNDGLQQRLQRIVFSWRDESTGAPLEAVETSTVLQGIVGWRVEGLTADGWQDVRAHSESRVRMRDPTAIRIVFDLVHPVPRSVTGVAWRAMAGEAP